MVDLVPMDDAELAAFLARPRDDYVAELVGHGLSAGAAATKIRDEQDAAFPGGRPAAGHRLFAVRRDADRVGHLWIGPAPDGGTSWWVWEVRIDERYQGQGIGRRTMELAEVEAIGAGASALGLSVSGSNARARRFYDSLGFEPVAVRMHKPLA